MHKTVVFRTVVPLRADYFTDNTEYGFYFDVIDSSLVGEPEERASAAKHKIKVGITYELLTNWRLDNASEDDLVRILFHYARRYVEQKIKDGTLTDYEELLLSTGEHREGDCPLDISRIPDPVGFTADIAVDYALEKLVKLIPESPALAQPMKEQPGTLPMAQIFLCYAEEDEEKVGDLYQRLSNAGFKPWMARKDLIGGERWESRISQAIRRSDLFLACLSANSIDKRGWIQREIKDALDIWQEKLGSDIYLIPVRLEDCEVPESLREFHWVSLFEEDGWTRLVKAIQVGMKRRAETPVESITSSRTPPLATRRSAARIGDTIPEVGLAKKDLSMTLIGWAESDIAVGGPYIDNELYTFTTRPRMKFIILEFEFHNNWVREQETPYFDKGEVRTDKGYFYQVWSPPGGIHSEEYAPRPSTQEEVENLGGSGAFEDLLPERSVRGHVVFEIPEDEEPEEVELSQVPVAIKLD